MLTSNNIRNSINKYVQEYNNNDYMYKKELIYKEMAVSSI